MKKATLSFTFIVLSLFSFAQIGIGTTTPDPSSKLDIKSDNKGVLLPRVALTGTGDTTTIVNPAPSLLVYNTASNGSGATAVTPGFYYWNNSAWVNMSGTGSPSSTWTLGGNSGAHPATSFIGTTDNVALKFRVNNVAAGEIHPDNGVTAFGLQALSANTSGVSNSAYGLNSLLANTIGNFNTAVGLSTMSSNTEGSENAAIGVFSLSNNNTGRNNTAVGYSSLSYNFTGNNNTAIGSRANVSSGDLYNATAIGADAYVACSNCVVLGNGANVGIGEAEPDKKLTVNSSDEGFIASFVNTNANNGDGILIKLGKTHPAYNGSGWINIPNPIAQLYAPPSLQIRDWVLNHQQFDWHQLLNLYPNALLAGTGFQIANVVIDQINSNAPDISIPSKRVLNETVIFNGWSFVPKLVIPELNTPAFTVALPDIPRLPEVIPPVAGSMVPNISFNDANDNSLSNKNQFISFVDKANRELGSIRAESVTDWQNNYLSADFFTKFTMSLIGLDFVNSISWAGSYFTDMTSSYNSLGVQYVSGHGDYAEWLARTDIREPITPGDIVGVKSGKITRDLTTAEQIRVVSTNPIMLGNAPEKAKESTGNKIAFMGQVPVKVMGPVKSGDYIIAKAGIAGYGNAVSPENLTVKDLKLAVGRSWETNTASGAKLVNTLVGIDREDYVKVLEGLERQMNLLEEKFDLLSAKLLPSAIKNNGKKK